MRKGPGPQGPERREPRRKRTWVDSRRSVKGHGEAPGGLINKGIKNTRIQTQGSFLPASTICQLNPG